MLEKKKPRRGEADISKCRETDYKGAMMAHPAMVAVGAASYSIYIYHWMVIELLVPFGPFVAVPSAVIGSIVVGMAGAAIIERPVYAARKLLRFPRPPAPKPAA